MPSSRPHQRTNARVSACQTGLGNHTATKPSSTVLVGNSSGIHLHENGLVDTLNDIGLVIGLDPVSRTCIPPRTPGGAIVQPESGSPRGGGHAHWVRYVAFSMIPGKWMYRVRLRRFEGTCSGSTVRSASSAICSVSFSDAFNHHRSQRRKPLNA